MKIFLMYYDRYESATTSKMLPIAHYVLCHKNKDKFKCIGDQGSLIQTHKPKGIQHNFNFGLEMLEEDEWGVFMSDDLVCGKSLKDGKFVKLPPEIIINELISILPVCNKAGIKLVGLNSTGNPFYAKKKYSKYGLVDGRCFAIKKSKFRFHEQINTIPDYYATAYHLKKHRGNLILNHHFLEFKRYSKGGLGSIKDRAKDKKKDVSIMKMLFPENVRITSKPGEPSRSHIMIKRSKQ